MADKDPPSGASVSPIPNGKPVQPIRDDEAPQSVVSPRNPQPSSTLSPPVSNTQIQQTLRNLTDRTLTFLSNSTNETLGACLIGLTATTYFIFGRVGLLLIGVAGGVVLHATWEGVRGDDRDWATREAERERRREVGVDVVRRVLDWREGESERRSRRGAEGGDERVLVALGDKEVDFTSTGLPAKTAAALDLFANTLIKDYVYWWYEPQLPNEESFPSACRRTLRAFLYGLTAHLRRKRPADVFLDFLTNASSILIVFLHELNAAISLSPSSASTDPAACIATYLEAKPEGALSYILDPVAQEAKFADAAEDLLQAYLDPKAYNCLPVRTFLKEVLSRLVLGVTVGMCARPEWINEWIVYALEESEGVDASYTGTAAEVVDGVSGGGGEERSARGLPPGSGNGVAGERVEDGGSAQEHKRTISAAEEAMDEAMREAKRLTQMMVEEDERRAREQQEDGDRTLFDDSVTDGGTLPVATQDPTDRERLEGIVNGTGNPWSDITDPSSSASRGVADSPRTSTSADMEGASISKNPHEPTTSPTAAEALTQTPQTASSQPQHQPQTQPPQSLTLLNAQITLLDDTLPTDKPTTTLKQKPQLEYLIQIEPLATTTSAGTPQAIPGYMIARKYSDFESLHEVLRRISVITGLTDFVERHSELPKWRGKTKGVLRGELEGYLRDAVGWQPLAESEGMKRFLERERGSNTASSSNGNAKVGAVVGGGGVGGSANPANTNALGKFGGDVMNVLTKAPKQGGMAVLGGGKAFVGGVAGLAGTVGAGVGGVVGAAGGGKKGAGAAVQRTNTSSSLGQSEGSGAFLGHRAQGSTATLEGSPSSSSVYAGSFSGAGGAGRGSQESFRQVPASPGSGGGGAYGHASKPSMSRHVSTSSVSQINRTLHNGVKSSPFSRSSLEVSSGGTAGSPNTSTTASGLATPNRHSQSLDDLGAGLPALPPRPSEMQDAYLYPQTTPTTNTSTSCGPKTEPPTATSTSTKTNAPLTDPETAVAVELLFALTSELYTLSSAWNFRRTLLNAAKNFLLRPGNPQLTAIRDLLQTTLLDANLSDEGMAAHIYKLRENALPSAEEMEVWARDFPEKSLEAKEALRVRARGLLVKRGMPVALQSVMGSAASGEALGRVFDFLQVERVARGLVWGVLVQGVRVVCD